MSDENKVTFESDDYYGPTMKLVVNCASIGAVDFIIEGSHTGIDSSLTYTLYMGEDVEKVIDQLIAWRERDRERLGR